MRETTFNLTNQVDGSNNFSSTFLWLHALYAEASKAKFSISEFYQVAQTQINFSSLEKKLGYQFSDKKFLITSLLQSTFSYEMNDPQFPNNERLEFLGDSLVNFMVGKKLYNLFPNHPEGDLSRLRGALVNEEKLAELARTLKLGEFLFVGKGEFRSQGTDKDSILADGLEALIGAIYFDLNEKVTALEEVFAGLIKAYERDSEAVYFSLEHLETHDPKSKLQELLMAQKGELPQYKAFDLENGQGFRVEVWISNKKIIEDIGTSKKKLEKKLAKKIIEEKLHI